MKRKSAFEIALHYRPAPRHRRDGLCHALRAAIVDGRLKPGQRLPSTRDIAALYGLARSTVVASFEQLASEAYLVARQGAGHFVCAVLPENSPHRPAVGLVLPRTTPIAPPLARRAAALARSPFALGTPAAPLPLTPHLPDLVGFPWKDWVKEGAKANMALSLALRSGGSALGHEPLRAAIADYLGSARGVRCDANQVLIVSGMQQALDLTARLLLEPGDEVLIEDPGYPGALRLLEAQGARLVPVAVDAQGFDIRRAAAGNTARLAYVTPAHQAPSGVSLSAPRREALLAWATRASAWIFEDDYDSEFRYSGPPLPALHALDRAGSVLHAGSFSKTLFPALRLAYLVLPESLREVFAAARSILDRHPPIEPQAAAAAFIGSGRYAIHLRRMRLIYQERRHALATAVLRHLGGAMQLAPDAAGLETVGWLASGLDDLRIARRARAAGLGVEPVSQRFRHAAARRPGLLLGFAATPTQSMDGAVATLAGCFD